MGTKKDDDDDYVQLLVESPILFFVLSHKAVETELAQIRRVAVEALDSSTGGDQVVDELCRRLHFLKIVYKYHCAAEDEVNNRVLNCAELTTFFNSNIV